MLHSKKDTCIPIFDFRNEARAADDLGTVSLRIYRNGKRQFLSTGVRVRRREWSDSRWVVGRPDAAELNARIREAMAEVDRAAGCPIHSVRPADAPFLDWVSAQIDLLPYAPDTIHRHRQMLSELEAFGRIRHFRDVNARNLAAFFQFISQRTVTKAVDGRLVTQPISQTSVYTYHRRLSKWIRLAIAQDLVAHNALSGFKVPRGEYAQREHLTRSEMDAWLEVTLPYPYLIRARDLFAIQCGTGLSYVDMMQTDFSRMEKSGDFWVLTGTRQKTGKPYFIVVLPFAADVLSRYGCQLPTITNQKYNNYLKQVAACAGIHKKISSHVGRHTYACLCLSAGVRIEAVQRTLGHSDIRTTQVYARLVDQDVLRAFGDAKSRL